MRYVRLDCMLRQEFRTQFRTECGQGKFFRCGYQKDPDGKIGLKGRQKGGLNGKIGVRGRQKGGLDGEDWPERSSEGCSGQ